MLTFEFGVTDEKLNMEELRVLHVHRVKCFEMRCAVREHYMSAKTNSYGVPASNLSSFNYAFQRGLRDHLWIIQMVSVTD